MLGPNEETQNTTAQHKNLRCCGAAGRPAFLFIILFFNLQGVASGLLLSNPLFTCSEFSLSTKGLWPHG